MEKAASKRKLFTLIWWNNNNLLNWICCLRDWSSHIGTGIFKNLPAAWSVLQISFCHKNSIYPLLLLTMLPCARYLYIFLLLHNSGSKENKHLSTVNIPEVSNAPLPVPREKKMSSFKYYSLSVLQGHIWNDICGIPFIFYKMYHGDIIYYVVYGFLYKSS